MEFPVLGRQEHRPSPANGGMSAHSGCGQHMGSPYPDLVKPEVWHLGWLLAASASKSGVSALLSSSGGEELSLCKVGGQRGEPLTRCDTRSQCLGAERGSASSKRVREAKASGSTLSSQRPQLLWALLPPHTTDLSKEASASLMWMDGLQIPLWVASQDVSSHSLIRPEPASHLASELSSGRGAHSLLPHSSQTSSKIP